VLTFQVQRGTRRAPNSQVLEVHSGSPGSGGETTRAQTAAALTATTAPGCQERRQRESGGQRRESKCATAAGKTPGGRALRPGRRRATTITGMNDVPAFRPAT